MREVVVIGKRQLLNY